MLESFKKNIHIYFLAFVLLYSLVLRFIDPRIVAVFLIVGGLYLFAYDFYHFFLVKFQQFKVHTKNKEQLEYSWGYVNKQKSFFTEIIFMLRFIFELDFVDYKNYLKSKSLALIFIIFVGGDLIFAFKNLDLYSFGVYISMSVFCKLVFIGYYYFQQKLKNVDLENKDMIFEIFNSFLNLFLTCSTIIFVLLFFASKIFNDLFLGPTYIPFNTTLPFIFLANIALAVAFIIYKTSVLINKKSTHKILKVYAVFFTVAFIFSNNNSLDSVTYFVVGTSCVLSIFLYNLIIKQPLYIKNTYNHLF